MVRLFRLLAAMGLMVLGACTAQPVAQPTLAPDPTLAAPTAAPPVAATLAAPTASEPTIAATTAPPIAATTAPATQDAIPIGQTPEGYHYLGNPNAPVTITFYSDFF